MIYLLFMIAGIVIALLQPIHLPGDWGVFSGVVNILIGTIFAFIVPMFFISDEEENGDVQG